MKRLSWILTLPLMVVAVVFAIANREVVMLDLWPLAMTIQAPLFVLVLGSAVVGLLAGAMVAWFSGGPTRRRAREARRRAAELEREIARLRNNSAEIERSSAVSRATGGTTPGLPAVPAPNHVATGGGPRMTL
ncbi:MAG: lipopolysaccharide assembly protein LapA domain-containing protein [Alphaproteobacteria bacterium]